MLLHLDQVQTGHPSPSAHQFRLPFNGLSPSELRRIFCSDEGDARDGDAGWSARMEKNMSKTGNAPQVRELQDSELELVSGGLGLMGVSNVSKTRSEISMTFARNARA